VLRGGRRLTGSNHPKGNCRFFPKHFWNTVESTAVVCAERIRLAKQYSQLVNVYADLVTEMQGVIGLGLESEVDVIRRSCRLALETAEKAKIALYRHEADHHCTLPAAPHAAVQV